MKKLMLTVAGMLFVSILAVNAQDTIQYQKKDTVSKDAQKDVQKDVQKDQPNPNLRDLTTIKQAEIPSALRTTLQGSDTYKGWDASTTMIYRSRSGEEFVVEIHDGTEVKTYRFDKNGKPIKE